MLSSKRPSWFCSNKYFWLGFLFCSSVIVKREGCIQDWCCEDRQLLQWWVPGTWITTSRGVGVLGDAEPVMWSLCFGPSPESSSTALLQVELRTNNQTVTFLCRSCCQTLQREGEELGKRTISSPELKQVSAQVSLKGSQRGESCHLRWLVVGCWAPRWDDCLWFWDAFQLIYWIMLESLTEDWA